jgi:hypothetical protein
MRRVKVFPHKHSNSVVSPLERTTFAIVDVTFLLKTSAQFLLGGVWAVGDLRFSLDIKFASALVGSARRLDHL